MEEMKVDVPFDPNIVTEKDQAVIEATKHTALKLRVPIAKTAWLVLLNDTVSQIQPSVELVLVAATRNDTESHTLIH